MVDIVLVPQRREEMFDKNGNPTLRFIRFLESLTNSTNSGGTVINDNSELIAINSQSISNNQTAIGNNAQSILDNSTLIGNNATAIIVNAGDISDNTDLINALIQQLTEATNPSAYNAQSQWLQMQIDGLPEFTIDTTGFTFDSTKITFDKVIA